jgi:hypothetical protein
MVNPSRVADIAQKGLAVFFLGGTLWMGTEATIMGYRMINAANARISAEVGFKHAWERKEAV